MKEKIGLLYKNKMKGKKWNPEVNYIQFFYCLKHLV